jgi:hypothetical protein
VVVDIVITPEPSDEERAAIVAALEQESSEAETHSPWPETLLPERDEPLD